MCDIAICPSVSDCQLWSCNKATRSRGDNHICLVRSACKLSQMCLVMKSMSTALTATYIEAGITRFITDCPQQGRKRLFTFYPAPALSQPACTWWQLKHSRNCWHYFVAHAFHLSFPLCVCRIPFKIGQPKKQIVSKTVSQPKPS